jgi:hypothetical protein
MLFILKNDLTIPKSEIIVKSASIAVALNCELPTSVNLPNFLVQQVIFPKIFGIVTKLS